MSDTPFAAILALVAVLAGSIASIAGFGIGSLLTPLLAVKTGAGIAVAGISIAHLFGTALRFILLRKHLHRRIWITFGLTSAAGGLAGALLHAVSQNLVLTIVFGCLLVFAGLGGLTGLSDRLRFRGAGVWLAGALSGLFGGMVGNQGGIRSAALLGFDLNKEQFVATATGIALLVDAARVPVYLAIHWNGIASIWQLILVATAGVVFGTVFGRRILERLPDLFFRKAVAVVILLVGVLVLVHR